MELMEVLATLVSGSDTMSHKTIRVDFDDMGPIAELVKKYEDTSGKEDHIIGYSLSINSAIPESGSTKMKGFFLDKPSAIEWAESNLDKRDQWMVVPILGTGDKITSWDSLP